MQAGDGAAAPMMVLRVLACTGTAVHDRCWREAPLLALEARRGANSCHVLATRACDAQGLKARTLPRFSHRRCGLRVAGAEQTSPVFIATITTTEAAGWAVDAPVAACIRVTTGGAVVAPLCGVDAEGAARCPAAR